MSYTITLDPTVLASGESENVIVLVDTSGSVSQEVALAVDYTDYYSRIATAIETIATNSTTIASKITSIEDHLNTAGTANNLARSIVNIDNHLDIALSNNLAGKISNIESHFNSFDSLYQINLSNTSGSFFENEFVRDSSLNTARVVKYFENTLIVDSVSNTLIGSNLTGIQSSATATILDIIAVKNVGKEIAEFNRQEDVYRVVLNHGGTNQTRSLVYDRDISGGPLTISTPGNITIDEKDSFTLRSVNTRFSSDAEPFFITRTQNPLNLADEAIENDNITGQGTKTIVWNTTYIDAGTYYWFTSSRNRSGSITINYKGFNADEKIQGTNGGIGYVRSYIPISDIDLRIVDVQAIFKDFSLGENIIGLFNNNSAIIADIIKLNAGSSGARSSFGQSPSEAFSLAALYKLYVEDGQILNTDQEVSPAEQQQALRKIGNLINKGGNL